MALPVQNNLFCTSVHVDSEMLYLSSWISSILSLGDVAVKKKQSFVCLFYIKAAGICWSCCLLMCDLLKVKNLTLYLAYCVY